MGRTRGGRSSGVRGTAGRRGRCEFGVFSGFKRWSCDFHFWFGITAVAISVLCVSCPLQIFFLWDLQIDVVVD